MGAERKADMTLEDVKKSVWSMNTDELNALTEELYNEYFDNRKAMDERMLVNEKMYSNHYLYEARMYESLAKFLYVKAEVMMRKG